MELVLILLIMLFRDKSTFLEPVPPALAVVFTVGSHAYGETEKRHSSATLGIGETASSAWAIPIDINMGIETIKDARIFLFIKVLLSWVN